MEHQEQDPHGTERGDDAVEHAKVEIAGDERCDQQGEARRAHAKGLAEIAVALARRERACDRHVDGAVPGDVEPGMDHEGDTRQEKRDERREGDAFPP